MGRSSQNLRLELLPGLLCDHAVWEHLSSQYNGSQIADYGHLDSIEAMATYVLETAPAEFALAGHSMGGRVALEVVRQAPERVKQLILLDSGYLPRVEGDAGEQERAGRMALLEIARTKGMRAVGEKWVQGMVHPGRLQDQPLIESILQMIERKTPEIFAAQINALLNRPDATPVLQSLTCPTLLMCGREDSWSPLARHQDMQMLAPASELIAIKNSGHMSTMEQPQAVTAAIQGWLAN